MPIWFEGKPIESEADSLVLDALLEAGIAIDNGCRSGACQRCLLRAEGEFSVSHAQKGLSASLQASHHFLSCQAKCKDIDQLFSAGETAVPCRMGPVVEHSFLSSTVVLLRIDMGSRFEFEAGQFVRIETEEGLSRSYSIATPSGTGDGVIDLHIRLIEGGRMSEIVGSADVVNQSFLVHGPMGDCVYRRGSVEPILMIASGTGLAPLYGVLVDALEAGHGQPIWLYHGSTDAEGLYFRPELGELAKRFESFQYVPCADRVLEGNGIRLGSPLDVALADHCDLTGLRVYCCGHPDLVRSAQKRCFLAGADLPNIHVDAFERQ